MSGSIPACTKTVKYTLYIQIEITINARKQKWYKSIKICLFCKKHTYTQRYWLGVVQKTTLSLEVTYVTLTFSWRRKTKVLNFAPGIHWNSATTICWFSKITPDRLIKRRVCSQDFRGGGEGKPRITPGGEGAQLPGHVPPRHSLGTKFYRWDTCPAFPPPWLGRQSMYR